MIHFTLQKLSSTKLRMFETSNWVVGNSNILMQQVAKSVNVVTATYDRNYFFQFKKRCRRYYTYNRRLYV